MWNYPGENVHVLVQGTARWEGTEKEGEQEEEEENQQNTPRCFVFDVSIFFNL